MDKLRAGDVYFIVMLWMLALEHSLAAIFLGVYFLFVREKSNG
jgi:hypothetical protein